MPIPEPLSVQPGIQLLRASDAALVDLEQSYQCPGLRSSILDFPVSAKNRPVTVGRFEMRPSVDFPFFYEYLEIKTIVTGKIVVRDEAGARYEAGPGDVFIFSPPTLVMFCAESDGTAVYVGHRGGEPSFLPGFEGVVETPIPESVRAWWTPMAATA